MIPKPYKIVENKLETTILFDRKFYKNIEPLNATKTHGIQISQRFRTRQGSRDGIKSDHVTIGH